MTVQEREELFLICSEWRSAATKLFNTDWYNYSFLGNETPHLHGNLIPRYSSSREFADTEFTDPLWGKHYETSENFTIEIDTLQKIQAAFITELAD